MILRRLVNCWSPVSWVKLLGGFTPPLKLTAIFAPEKLNPGGSFWRFRTLEVPAIFRGENHVSFQEVLTSGFGLIVGDFKFLEVLVAVAYYNSICNFFKPKTSHTACKTLLEKIYASYEFNLKIFQVDGNELNATAKLFQVVAIYSNFAVTLRNRPTWDPPKMEEGFLMEPLCFREISGWWKMIHLDRFSLVKNDCPSVWPAASRERSQSTLQPPTWKFSENHRLQNAGRDGIC